MQFPHSHHTPPPPLQHFRTLLNFILRHIFFLFNSQHYIRGTAMGTSMAPSYAKIFMASLEIQMLLDQFPPQPPTWLRFIHDIFMLWTHGSSALTNFLQRINSFHPTIKFSHQQTHTSVNFLDSTVLLTEQRTLQSTLYIKPTDKGLLLHHSSHNPNACTIRASFTLEEPSDTDISSPTTVTYTNNYSDCTKSFQPEAISTPQSLLHLTKPLHKLKANHSFPPKKNTSTNGILLPFVIPYHTDLLQSHTFSDNTGTFTK